MRSSLGLFFLLALGALACGPVEMLLAPAPLAPRLQTLVPSQPYARVKAPTPTRAVAPAIFNGAPLALKATAYENIYTAAGVSSAYQQTISADAVLVAKKIKSDLGWAGSPRANVYIFPSRAAWLQGIAQVGGLSASEVGFQASLQGDAWITIGGTARPGIYLYPIQQSASETLHMLAHEYTHVIQQQTLGGRAFAPDWFLEGMAEAEGWRIAATQYPREYARVQAENQALVAKAAKEKNLFPLTAMMTQRAWQIKLERPWSATLEYAESQMAVEYLQKLKGVNTPMNILIMTANDKDFTTAFQQSTGMSISAFEAKFFASLK